HEINNPLASIASCAEGLQKRAARGELDELGDYLQTIASEAWRAKDITSRLLELARPAPRTRGEFELGQLFRHVERMLGTLVDCQDALGAAATGTTDDVGIIAVELEFLEPRPAADLVEQRGVTPEQGGICPGGLLLVKGLRRLHRHAVDGLERSEWALLAGQEGTELLASPLLVEPADEVAGRVAVDLERVELEVGDRIAVARADELPLEAGCGSFIEEVHGFPVECSHHDMDELVLDSGSHRVDGLLLRLVATVGGRCTPLTVWPRVEIPNVHLDRATNPSTEFVLESRERLLPAFEVSGAEFFVELRGDFQVRGFVTDLEVRSVVASAQTDGQDQCETRGASHRSFTRRDSGARAAP
ncbi:MAG: hypothetical protein KC431_18760, partial [Myxococcales bacterium]|nr:hypothetical protein [Myxococcales bacterium]